MRKVYSTLRLPAVGAVTACGTNVKWHEYIKARPDAAMRCASDWDKISGGACRQWREARTYD